MSLVFCSILFHFTSSFTKVISWMSLLKLSKTIEITNIIIYTRFYISGTLSTMDTEIRLDSTWGNADLWRCLWLRQGLAWFSRAKIYHLVTYWQIWWKLIVSWSLVDNLCGLLEMSHWSKCTSTGAQQPFCSITFWKTHFFMGYVIELHTRAQNWLNLMFNIDIFGIMHFLVNHIINSHK